LVAKVAQKRGTLKKNQAGFSRKSSAEESQKIRSKHKKGCMKQKILKLVIIYHEKKKKIIFFLP